MIKTLRNLLEILVNDFEALGEEMRGRKEELLSQGMAATDEADMVAKSKGQGDSPAKAARATSSKTD